MRCDPHAVDWLTACQEVTFTGLHFMQSPVGRLKQLDEVVGRVPQKDLRAAGSGHNVVAELRTGGTQSCHLARKIIHNKMDAIPATSFRASAIRHGPTG
jgi:hypothetical protein